MCVRVFMYLFMKGGAFLVFVLHVGWLVAYDDDPFPFLLFFQQPYSN